MKLTVVGASGSMSGPQGPASSYLVQTDVTDQHGKQRTWSVLLDLGPGSFGAMWNYLDPRQLDAVVFTHGHADHMADVISLYVHNRWNPRGCMNPIQIYGPANTKSRVQQIDGWATEDELDALFDFRVVQAYQPFTVGPLNFTPFPALHPVEAYGYRVETERGSTRASLAFTGDTDACASMTDMAAGVDLLLSEAAFTAADTLRGMHLDGGRAGQLATDAGVGQLVLTHIQPWTDPALVYEEARTTWSGQLSLAQPGQVYAVGQS